ncbi:MAG: hypothetical protein AB1405_03575 [Bdellovibrionota bacterium]
MTEVPPHLIAKSEGHLRWFSDARHDLFVWFGERDEIIRFQFCYGKGTAQEEVVEWRRGDHVKHSLVDDGEVPGSLKQSPLIVANGPWRPKDALEAFKAASGGIDPVVREPIEQILQE